MKKYLGLLIIVLVGLFVALPVKADEVKELNQDVFDDADTTYPAVVNGVKGSDDSTYFTVSAGSYKLVGDVELDTASIIFNGTVVLDLNGHTIAFESATIGENANLTIKGNGTVIVGWEGILATDNAKLTINGGTFNGNISMAGTSSLTVTDGTFTNDMSGTININGTGDVNISGGTFTAGASAMYVNGNATVNISGGEFISLGDNGIEAGAGTLNISGGTFKGIASGIAIHNATPNLSGGKFIAEEGGAIIILDDEATKELFNSWVLEGYEYSPAVEVSAGTYFIGSQKELEVKKIGSEEETAAVEEETKTNNPNTSDNILLYITLLGLSIIGLITVRNSDKILG